LHENSASRNSIDIALDERVYVCKNKKCGVFKKYVLEKHGELGGKLGEEMEKAISLYLIHESAMKAYVKKRKDKLEADRRDQTA